MKPIKLGSADASTWEGEISQLSDAECKAAYYYEYSRLSVNLCRLVEQYREELSWDEKGNPSKIFEHVKRNKSWPSPEILNHPRHLLLHWLTWNCYEFPHKSFFDLTPKVRLTPMGELRNQMKNRKTFSQTATMRSVDVFAFLHYPNPIRACLEMQEGLPGISYAFKQQQIECASNESLFCRIINWSKPNREILSAFESWLKSARPKSLRKNSAAESGTLCITGEKLPFRFKQALLWLKTLHQRESAAKPTRRENPENSRSLRREIAKAKAILEWFDGSGTWNADKFRK